MKPNLHSSSWLVLLALLGCNPGVFSRDTKAEPSQVAPDAGVDSGAGGESARSGTTPRAGRGGAGGSAGSGGSSAAHGGGTTEPEAGTGDEGGSGEGGAAGADAASGTGGADAVGGAGGTDAAGGGGGAGGEGGAAANPCDPSPLDVVRTTVVSDSVLQVPEPFTETVNGVALRVSDERLLWMLATPFESPVRGRPVIASASIAQILAGQAALELPADLLPGEPSGFGLSTGITATWRDGDGAFAFFFVRYAGFELRGVGVARATLETQAPAEVLAATDGLFPSGEPVMAADGGVVEAFTPRFLTGVVPIDDILYAYVCQTRPDAPDEQGSAAPHFQPCRLARVRADQVSDGTRYEFWSETGWSHRLADANVVIDHVPGVMTVTWNTYLQKYVAVHSGAQNDVVLRWADRLQGPFQALGGVATQVATGGMIPLSYAAAELPLPRDTCDPSLFVAYTLPLQREGADPAAEARFETRVLALRFE